MISKNEFVRQWFRSDTLHKLELGETLKISSDWDWSKSDPFIKTFLGTLAELVVLRYLDLNYHQYELPEYQDNLYQVGDESVKFRNQCDLKLYSTRREAFVSTEIKSTSKCIVESISNTLVIPDELIAKAKKEGAQFMIIVDRLDTQSRDIISPDYGKLKVSNAHIIFYDIYSSQKAILANTAYVNKLIEDILK